MKPNKEDRKKFDIDLEYGEVREQMVADMLQNKKIEVKSERDVWQRTGNIAIEYECYGKPSGINATESDYWFHNLCLGDDTFATIVFDTKNLRKIIDNLDYKKSVSGGDNNAAKMYLLNLQKLFSSDVIKAFKDGQNNELRAAS
jgi:5'-deoxynucleotidase YfbR-like HD superfamily hydrolase|tara:strand:+ start:353 stop:784 length:432 start_codon:yes stop_codon:yes gene_type:complete